MSGGLVPNALVGAALLGVIGAVLAARRSGAHAHSFRRIGLILILVALALAALIAVDRVYGLLT